MIHRRSVRSDRPTMHDRPMDGVSLRGSVAAFVAEARTATLATIAPDGRPRLVPICFVLLDEPRSASTIVSPLDEKPKASDDPLALARVRDLADRPEATILVDRWSEDWARLGWVRIEVLGDLVGADPAAVAALLAKYPQYRTHRLEDRPMLRFRVERVVSWGDLGPDRASGTGRAHAAGGSGSSSSPGGSRPR